MSGTPWVDDAVREHVERAMGELRGVLRFARPRPDDRDDDEREVPGQYKVRAEAAEQRVRELEEFREVLRDVRANFASMVKGIEVAEAKLAMAIEALRFYGDESRYDYDGEHLVGEYIANPKMGVLLDNGRMACEALAEIEGCPEDDGEGAL